MENDSTLKQTSFSQIQGKVIILGDYGVGKTRIINTVCIEETKEKHEGVSIDENDSENQFLNYEYENKQMVLKIWDTVIAGQEKYKSITLSFYKDLNGVFLCFDLTNQQSFLNLSFWIKQIKQHANEEIVIILLGNKNDDKLHIEVFESEIVKLQQELSCPYYQTSSFTKENLQESFEMMASMIYKMMKQTQINENALKLKNTKRINQNVEDDRSQCFC